MPASRKTRPEARPVHHSAYRSLLGLIFLASPALAVDDVVCPPTLDVPVTLPQVEGWQAIRQQGEARPLERIVLRQGADPTSPPLPQSSYLREERGEARTIVARWDLAELRQSAPELWLACLYAGTVVELTRRLPPNAEACEFRMEYGLASVWEKGGCWQLAPKESRP